METEKNIKTNLKILWSNPLHITVHFYGILTPRLPIELIDLKMTENIPIDMQMPFRCRDPELI